jgi:hypothetical protein
MGYDIDINELDPGIRETVRWLRGHSFETVDSGDGVSKAGEYGEGDYLPFPHVAMLCTPETLIYEADRLRDLLEEQGAPMVVVDPETDVHIEASYSPLDGQAVLMLSNVDDKLLGLT